MTKPTIAEIVKYRKLNPIEEEFTEEEYDFILEEFQHSLPSMNELCALMRLRTAFETSCNEDLSLWDTMMKAAYNHLRALDTWSQRKQRKQIGF